MQAQLWPCRRKVWAHSSISIDVMGSCTSISSRLRINFKEGIVVEKCKKITTYRHFSYFQKMMIDCAGTGIKCPRFPSKKDRSSHILTERSAHRHALRISLAKASPTKIADRLFVVRAMRTKSPLMACDASIFLYSERDNLTLRAASIQ